MSDIRYREIAANGLWKNNPALVQLLGLCPLLGVSNSVVNALGLGIATMAVLLLSNTAVSSVRRLVPDTVRLPTFMIIIASFTTCAELLMQAYTYELYLVLGIFIPIIVTNCALLGRADGFARKQPVPRAAWDGLCMGAGFVLALLALGAMRELLGAGTLLADFDLLVGEMASGWTVALPASYHPLLVAALPPGAFICVGFLIALKNLVDQRVESRRVAPLAVGSQRARVTGRIAAN